MLSYVIRRVLIAIPVFFGITLIGFMLLLAAPGDAVDAIMTPHMTEETAEAKAQAMGLNDPPPVQYVRWLGMMLRGDFGYSLKTNEPVLQLIGDRIGPTLTLMGSALVIGFVLAIIIGIVSAVKQYSWIDYLAVTSSFIGISIPNFFLALGLVYIFSVQLGWLPSSGIATVGVEGSLSDRLAHLVLPVTVLAVNIAGRNVRYVRSSMLDVLGQDYLRTARAKGLTELKVIGKHAFRNGLITIITVLGFEIPILFAGAVVTETIFSWPGIGQLAIQSINARDYPTVMALNVITATLVLVTNVVVDILYAVVDPRITYS